VKNAETILSGSSLGKMVKKKAIKNPQEEGL